MRRGEGSDEAADVVARDVTLTPGQMSRRKDSKRDSPARSEHNRAVLSPGLGVREDIDMQASSTATRAVRFLCSEYSADKLAVLDVGCGRGDHLAHFGPGSLGLDAVATNIDAVRARGLEAELANVEDGLPKLDRRWDAAYCSNIVEHLVAPHLLLLRLHEVLTPNGLVFIMVPTVPPARPLDWLIRRIIGHNGYRAAEHIYAFTPRTAEFMVERAGYRVIETAFVAARGARLLRPLEPIFKEIGISALVVARRDPLFVYPEKRVRQFTPSYVGQLDQRN